MITLKDIARFRIDLRKAVKKEFAHFFDPASPETFRWAFETALYWFCHDWHDGSNSLGYAVLSRSHYKPSCMEHNIIESGDEDAEMLYDWLVDTTNTKYKETML